MTDFFFNRKPPDKHPLKVIFESAKFEYLDCVKRIDPLKLRKGESLAPIFEYRMEVIRIPGMPSMKVLVQAGGRFVAPRDMTINFIRIALFGYEGAILAYEDFPTELGGTFEAHRKQMNHDK